MFYYVNKLTPESVNFLTDSERKFNLKRDFRLIFPFLKWEFGGHLFDLFRMTSQGQTFFLTKSLRPPTNSQN